MKARPEFERRDMMGLTAQFVLWAIIVSERNCNEIENKVRVAWDVAEAFHRECSRRYQKYDEVQEQ